MDHHLRDVGTRSFRVLQAGDRSRELCHRRRYGCQDDDRDRGRARTHPHHREYRDGRRAVLDPQARQRSGGPRLRDGSRDGVRVHRGRHPVHARHLDRQAGRAEWDGRRTGPGAPSGLRVVVPAGAGLHGRCRQRPHPGLADVQVRVDAPRPRHGRVDRWTVDHHRRRPRHLRHHRARWIGRWPVDDPGGLLGAVDRRLSDRQGLQDPGSRSAGVTRRGVDGLGPPC